ncbi:MAG TPA: OsmC family protein [Candidatus Deferrimicrobiaceae bacterium]|nr:OsmC family protein [Candidatus Deferrimicrobiaceae bacterium]
MSTRATKRTLNGFDVGELEAYVRSVDADRTQADRNPTVVARWLGESRAAVSSTSGGPEVSMGGDDEPSAMNMLLRTLAACDVEVIAMTASLLGVEIESLSIEASGQFHVGRFLGLSSSDGPGYRSIAYTVRLVAPNARPEQVEALRQACLTRSPVGDTFERRVPVTMRFEASQR